MNAATEAFPPDPFDEPKLPEGLLETALAGPSDPRKNTALLELIHHMLPYAMKLIRSALDEKMSRREEAPTTGQMRELRSAQHVALPDDNPDEDDPEARTEIVRRTGDALDRATEAALISAAESFLGHWLKEFADIRSVDELAVQLIRIAYNRYQRRRRSDARLGYQIESASGASAGKSFLESRSDRSGQSVSEIELRDFLETQRRLTDGVLEGFSVRDRQIVLLHVAGKEPEEILELINRYRKNRKPCTLNTVHHVIETFQVQVNRLEDEDEPNEESPPNETEGQDHECESTPR